jgi:dTDP-4-amino-4,6-dideoxygalactose transaminase
LNFNQDEISCAIGLSTLRKLPAANRRRCEIVEIIRSEMTGSRLFDFPPLPPEATIAPFFFTIRVRTELPGADKLTVAHALAAEGVLLNPDYQYVVAEWPWVEKAAGRTFSTPNATAFRRCTFNLWFHERFSDEDARDIAACMRKVERHFVP